MSGYPHKAVHSLGMLGAAMLLVLIVGAAQPIQGQTYTVLHDFGSSSDDGAYSVAGLVRDQAGNLYGTTENGGAPGYGTVFKIDTSGNETVLHSFDYSDGANPYGGLALDSAGNLYGTTAFGGASGDGIVFKIDPTGNETVLYSFHGPDGEFPYASVVRDAAGNLYGTTLVGGYWGQGTVFKIDTSGIETVLDSFDGSIQGGYPFAGVILDPAGNLYGTTYFGGLEGYGTVFKIDTAGNETLIHSFDYSDGANPYGGLAMDSAGNLYGTTYVGGESGTGTVFKIDTSETETVLDNLEGYTYGGVAVDAAGNLYGTTYYGGDSNNGAVFKIDSSGNVTTIHSFDSSDGANPQSGVILDSAGNLYGTTYDGGSSGYGTAYEIVEVIPFSAFTAKVEITSGFNLKGDFTLGPGGPAVNPIAQGLTLTIGTYSVTIPPGSFQQAPQGGFSFDDTINGANLRMLLTQTGANAYEIQVHAQGVDLGTPSNPVTMTLTAGQNSGTTEVDAH